MNQKVTIMIPTYNQEEFIFEAVQSALEQDYDNIEIIISDDCSGDKTAEVAKNFLNDSRVKYYRNDQNLGRVNNYKRLLYEYATGDWVVNLDGDDYFTDKKFVSGAINHINDVQSNNSNVVGYLANHSNLKKISNKLIINKNDENTVVVSGQQYFLNYDQIGAFSHMACIYNREKALGLNFYNENFLAADYLSFMKLSLYGDIILSNFNIGVWRKHNNNASQSNLREKFNESIKVVEKLGDFASNFFSPVEIGIWLRKAKAGTKDNYVFDLVANSNGLKSYSHLFANFKIKYSYFILLLSLFKNSIFTNNNEK